VLRSVEHRQSKYLNNRAENVRHEVAVRREALGTEGGVRPSRWAVAAAWLELSVV
jgi:transposase-like protein